jgi:Protein of unknown function (DUF3108)
MMKFAAAFSALGLLAIAGPATAQPDSTADKRFEAVFSVNSSMGDVGDFTISFSQAGGAYQMQAARRVTGMFRMMAGDSQDYVYSARGTVGAGGVLQPSAYEHSGGRRGRVVRARFTPNDVVTTTDPPGMGMGNPAATPAQKRGVIDQLSAIAAMATSGDPCGRNIAVYMDGRSRFDFLVSPAGRVNVSTRGYSGEAIRCRVQFRPLAGFSDPQEAAELTFLFAETPSGVFAPIRIQMPTNDVGVVTLEAKSVSVNGAALR